MYSFIYLVTFSYKKIIVLAERVPVLMVCRNRKTEHQLLV